MVTICLPEWCLGFIFDLFCPIKCFEKCHIDFTNSQPGDFCQKRVDVILYVVRESHHIFVILCLIEKVTCKSNLWKLWSTGKCFRITAWIKYDSSEWAHPVHNRFIFNCAERGFAPWWEPKGWVVKIVSEYTITVSWMAQSNSLHDPEILL